MWSAYLATQPPGSKAHAATPISNAWGDSPQMADELGALIVSGKKTATCAAVAEYEAESSQPAREGDFTIVLDGRGQPMGIIETIELRTVRFGDVDATFAAEEGEGDRSLESWRRGHRAFFQRVLKRPISDDEPLLCERFRLVWPLTR